MVEEHFVKTEAPASAEVKPNKTKSYLGYALIGLVALILWQNAGSMVERVLLGKREVVTEQALAPKPVIPRRQVLAPSTQYDVMIEKLENKLDFANSRIAHLEDVIAKLKEKPKKRYKSLGQTWYETGRETLPDGREAVKYRVVKRRVAL